MKINVHVQFLYILFLKSFQDFINLKFIPGHSSTVYTSLNIMC